MRRRRRPQSGDVDQLNRSPPDAQRARRLKFAAGGGDARATNGKQFRQVALAQADGPCAAAVVDVEKQGGHPLA